MHFPHYHPQPPIIHKPPTPYEGKTCVLTNFYKFIKKIVIESIIDCYNRKCTFMYKAIFFQKKIYLIEFYSYSIKFFFFINEIYRCKFVIQIVDFY